MKLGFNLLMWTTLVTDEHWPIIERLKETGYDGVEVPMFEGTPDDYAKLGRRLAEIGLEATGLGVMPGDGKNAISMDAAERRAGLDHIKWIADCTAALGANLAVGPFHQPLGEFSGTGPTADEKAWAIDIHKQAAQYAGEQGVGLAVEPLNRFECYFLTTATQAAELVRAVDEPNYGYLYDTFHFNIEERSITDVISSTAQEIAHVHISENNRGTPGAGHINFQAVFDALRRSGYDGWLTVEAFGSALPDLAAATKVWRPFFKSDAEVYRGAERLIRNGWDHAASYHLPERGNKCAR